MPRLSKPAAATRMVALLVTCAAVHNAGAEVAACPLRSDESSMVPWCDTADRGDAMLQMGSKTIKMEKRSEHKREEEDMWKQRFEGRDPGFTQKAWEDAVDAAFGEDARLVNTKKDGPIKPILGNKYPATTTTTTTKVCCEDVDTEKEQQWPQVTHADSEDVDTEKEQQWPQVTHADTATATAEDTDTDKDREGPVEATTLKCPFEGDILGTLLARKCDPTKDSAVRAMSMENIKNVVKFLKTLWSASLGELTIPVWHVDTKKYVRVTKTVTEVTMYDVNLILVIPLTFHSKLSFVAHIGGGKPDYFVSHAWAGRFLNFASSIETHFKQVGAKKEVSTFYWVCTFANNQNEGYIKQDMGNDKHPTEAPFYRGIQLVYQVVSIQDEKDKTEAFTLKRAWCMFEMLVALKFKKPIVFMCNNYGFSEDGPLDRNRDANFGCTRDLLTHMFQWMPEEATVGSSVALKSIKKYIGKEGCRYAELKEVHQVGVGIEAGTDHKMEGMDCLAQKIKQIAEVGKSGERRGGILDTLHKTPSRRRFSTPLPTEDALENTEDGLENTEDALENTEDALKKAGTREKTEDALEKARKFRNPEKTEDALEKARKFRNPDKDMEFQNSKELRSNRFCVVCKKN